MSTTSAKLAVLATVAAVAALAAACTSSSSSTGGTTGSSPAPSTGVTVPPTSSTPPSTSDAPTTAATSTATNALDIDNATGTTSLTFGEDFVRTLYTHNLTTRPAGDATLKPVGSSGTTDRSTLPITGGTLTATGHGATGKLQHIGSGLIVSVGSHTLKLTDFTLVLDGTKSVMTAQVTTATTAPVTTVTVFQLTPTPGGKISGGRFTLASMRMYLTPAAARAFNTTLGTTAFTETDANFAGTVTTVIGEG